MLSDATDEYETNPCLNGGNPCLNGGECIVTDNSYACNCTPGYMGQNCSGRL